MNKSHAIDLGGHYRPRFTKLKACVMCGGPFMTTRKDATCCSARCRQTLSRHARGLQSLTPKQEMHLIAATTQPVPAGELPAVKAAAGKATRTKKGQGNKP